MSMHVAPSDFVYETDTGYERISFTMNHEVAHVVTIDQQTPSDAVLSRRVPGQGARDRRGSGNHHLRLPHAAPAHRAALASRRHRGLLRDLDVRRAGSRSGTVRRDGVSLDGARQRVLLRSARPRIRRHQGRLPGGRQRVSLWRAFHDLHGVSRHAREAGGVGVARSRQQRLLLVAVQARLRRDARSRLAGLDPVGARLPARQPRFDRPLPHHALSRPLAARVGFALAALSRRQASRAVRRHQLPGHGGAHRRDSSGWRADSAAARRQGPRALLGLLAGVRSRRRPVVLQHRQQSVARSDAAGSRDAQGHTAHQGFARRRSGVRS